MLWKKIARKSENKRKHDTIKEEGKKLKIRQTSMKMNKIYLYNCVCLSGRIGIKYG